MAVPEEVAADELNASEVGDDEEEDPQEVVWLSSDSEPEEHPALREWTPSSPESEAPEQQSPAPPPETSAGKVEEDEEEGVLEEGEVEAGIKPLRWPGWPGASVFRMAVAMDKVGGLIGRRGDIVRRLCEATRARVRVLDAGAGAAYRIVLISATEESQAELPPAMDAAIKIFMHINDIEKITCDETISNSAPEKCSARLIVPSAQATHLIGKQGATIKSIQEITGATVKIIDKDELLSYDVLDERIVAIHGAPLKVLHALKSVLGVLRKFLVDHGVLHLFERKNQAVGEADDNCKENQVNKVASDYHLPVNKDILLSDHRTPLSPKFSRYLLYGRDPSVCGPYLSHLSQANDVIQQITQTMEIPLRLAEVIIGVRGQNISYIRSVSGAVVDLEESRDYPNKVTVMIKGSSSQVQTAHQLVQETLSVNKEPPPRTSHSNLDGEPKFLISGHVHPANWDHLPSYRDRQPFIDRHGSSSLARFRGYRL